VSRPLLELRRAVAARRRAEERYRRALVTASGEYGYAQVARLTGVSRQAVRQLVQGERARNA